MPPLEATDKVSSVAARDVVENVFKEVQGDRDLQVRELNGGIDDRAIDKQNFADLLDRNFERLDPDNNGISRKELNDALNNPSDFSKDEQAMLKLLRKYFDTVTNMSDDETGAETVISQTDKAVLSEFLVNSPMTLADLRQWQKEYNNYEELAKPVSSPFEPSTRSDSSVATSADRGPVTRDQQPDGTKTGEEQAQRPASAESVATRDQTAASTELPLRGKPGTYVESEQSDSGGTKTRAVTGFNGDGNRMTVERISQTPEQQAQGGSSYVRTEYSFDGTKVTREIRGEASPDDPNARGTPKTISVAEAADANGLKTTTLTRYGTDGTRNSELVITQTPEEQKTGRAPYVWTNFKDNGTGADVSSITRSGLLNYQGRPPGVYPITEPQPGETAPYNPREAGLVDRFLLGVERVVSDQAT